ncbi:MAG: crotonase/enoyl-CoA hydratase family protein [Nitrosomonadales bacterium]|nr:crotonase/enoyl-CoA hydratase family protein [Nitrosomonadales bacterium]
MGKIEIFDYVQQPLAIECSQVSSRFDPEYGVLWLLMNPSGVPCFTQDFVSELLHYNRSVERSGGKIFAAGKMHPVRFSVLRSQVPGVFNLGGDLALFSRLIRSRDRQALMHYATICIDTLMSRIDHYNVPLITISLVEGDALGAGLETALSSDVIIAERRSRMGFPEILFNLVPGHGAYSLVARKIGAAQIEKMILSGKIYGAEELHEIGVVDVLVEDGEGEDAVHNYVRKHARSSNGFQALQRMRQRFNPVTYREMMDITTIWVDAAMQLEERDLKIMDRLVRSQQKHYGQSGPVRSFPSPESRKTGVELGAC